MNNAERQKFFDEEFRHRGIHSGIFRIIGKWAVSNEGDIMFEDLYPIYSYQLDQQDWDAHMSTKDWYREDGNREDFLKIYNLACERHRLSSSEK